MKNITNTTYSNKKINEKIEILEKEKLELIQEKEILQKEKLELEIKLKWFQEQYNLQQKRRFGRSSEKTPIDGQISIFNEAESEEKPEAPEPVLEKIVYERKKKVGNRKDLLENLPVETIEYQISDQELDCDNCGEKLHEMSKEIRRELKIIPPKVSIVEHVRFIYACRNCEKNNINTNIKTASMPKPALPGSIASSSAIAYVMNEKFVKAIPLYRQEQEWKRIGVKISRQTMANWMITSSNKWLSIIYERMKKHLIKKDILHADETTLQVLKEIGRSSESKSYMWLYRTGREGPPIILYDYQTTRAGKHAQKFLEGFKGFLHTDGYEGYSLVPEIISVGCWAHARRYFVDALKSMPEKLDDKVTITEEGKTFCDKLFSIEKKLYDVTNEERYRGRSEFSRPVLDSFKVWLDYWSSRVTRKSALGKAIYYCRNQWKKLEAFMLDGRLEIDNNRSERSIKPFVIGRKNWLFSNTPKGATASAIIYSIIETSKENELNPFEYLIYLLDTLPNIDIENIDEIDNILPWSDALPESCKIKIAKN